MNEKRIEKKFVYINGDISYKFFLISGMFKKMYPQRTVNSIYFDTEMLKDVWDNINGYGERKKIRIRWYNDLSKASVFLEKKRKIGLVTEKKVSDIGIFENYEDLCNYIQGNNFLKIYPIIEKKLNLRKKLFIQYQRNYYSSTCKRLRVTIDNSLKIFLNYPSKSINLDKNILELKYSVKDSKFANLFIKTNLLNNRNQKFSKYVNSFIELNDNGII